MGTTLMTGMTFLLTGEINWMIEVYTRDECIFCERAKTLLAQKNLPYVEKKLGVDFTRDWLLEQFPSARTYPVIVQDGMHTGGFTELAKQLNEETDHRKFLAEGNR